VIKIIMGTCQVFFYDRRTDGRETPPPLHMDYISDPITAADMLLLLLQMMMMGSCLS